MPETRLPQRVVSLQPSVTVTLRDLGLLERLVACTRYCLDVVPELRDGASAKNESYACAIIHDSWTAKAGEILATQPDLVIASVPYQIESLAEIMKCGIPFLGLAPKCLEDVYHDIMHIARVVSSEQPGAAEARGLALITRMQNELAAVRHKTINLPKPLVYCEEWGKPLILSQRWVAELVEAAGGRFFGEPGKQTTEDQVAAADPGVIIAAWCGAGDRVPLEKIVARRGWEQTKAGRDGRVYCINDEFLNTPASTLLQGLHALAAAIHPEMFAAENGLRKIWAHSAVI
ncbi:MAG TPA: ABC transporter substrate-binding protein [Candidatus Angelobacter sp.]